MKTEGAFTICTSHARNHVSQTELYLLYLQVCQVGNGFWSETCNLLYSTCLFASMDDHLMADRRAHYLCVVVRVRLFV
jgi:hypothetical protein